KNMWPALRAAFTAGSAFPDVFYYDMDVPEFMTAGWLADLSTGVRWENIEPYGKSFWTRPGAGGKTGTWAVPVEAASDEIYYNRKLFKELGITVPAGFAFTQDQFKDVIAKCAKAGYAAFATGAADRDWAAHYIPNALLNDKRGQPRDFELGMLNNPLTKDGKGHGQKFLGVAGSLGVAAKSPHLPLAIKVADAFADVEIGNMWMARTGVQTGIKTDPARIDSPLKWYFDEYGRVNKNTKWVDLTAQQVRVVMKPGLWDTYVATVNQGLPNKLLGPDEALAKLEEARLKGK